MIKWELYDLGPGKFYYWDESRGEADKYITKLDINYIQSLCPQVKIFGSKADLPNSNKAYWRFLKCNLNDFEAFVKDKIDKISQGKDCELNLRKPPCYFVNRLTKEQSLVEIIIHIKKL